MVAAQDCQKQPCKLSSRVLACFTAFRSIPASRRRRIFRAFLAHLSFPRCGNRVVQQARKQPICWAGKQQLPIELLNADLSWGNTGYVISTVSTVSRPVYSLPIPWAAIASTVEPCRVHNTPPPLSLPIMRPSGQQSLHWPVTPPYTAHPPYTVIQYQAPLLKCTVVWFLGSPPFN